MSPEGDKQPTLLFRTLPKELRVPSADRRELRSFARLLASRVVGGEFICLLTSDEELQRLNKAFLGHDFPTDVLSFPSGAKHGNLGEMAISIGRASAQAQKFQHSCFDEIRILMLHGVLHLAGLDHEQDKGAMKRTEERWRKAFALPATLIARGNVRRGTRT